MGLRLRILMLFLAAGLAGVTHGETIAFTNVNVVPMDSERVLNAQTVVIADGRITQLGDGSHVAIPEKARRIDGTGRYLIPGLYELHAHVPNGRADTERVLALFLANGITTIRGMLGAPGHLALRAQLDNGERLGPRLITSGPSFNGRSVSSAEQARAMVRQQSEAGYDFLKLHPGIALDEFDALVAAANELSMPFAGHVSAGVGVERALAAGQDCIDHLDGYMQALVPEDADRSARPAGFFGLALANLVEDDRIAPLAQRTAAAGVWNVPTQTLIENFASTLAGSELAARDHMRYMPRDTVRRWRQSKDSFLADENYAAAVAQRAVNIRRQLIKALHDAGAGLLLGSDAPQVFNVPGFASHEELALLVASGLTPFEALATGTTGPAVYFDERERRGIVATGYAADLILLERNPLADIGHSKTIAGVMIAGRWHSRADLDALLDKYDEQE